MDKILLIVILLLLAGCGTVQVTVDSATPLPDAANALDPVSSPSPTAVPPTASPLPPTATPVPPSPAATVTPITAARAASYLVAYVPADDQLNVRTTPDPRAQIVGTLAPATGEIELTGTGQKVGTHTWLPIRAGELSGWVNSLYLTEAVPRDAFCQDQATRALVERFREAIASGDEAALAEMVNPERGLHVWVNWWNPEVWLTGAQAENLLGDDTVHDWGVEDGSGNEIQGSFQEIILPLLERDLLPAGEIACNEILHGGTAGIVQLPEGVDRLNYYAFYRPPGPDQVEMDWGTWVVGVERWQGADQIAFLVHFNWEI